MRVTVVVPVFNTGAAIEPLIESLKAQTLERAEWEAIFVDDGSSDDTPELVGRLIAEEPNMRLIREAPSGWPGRPRNVGLDAAIGEYVFFSDDDDRLGPEALARLTEFASSHDADVVIPRMIGRNRGVPSITRTVIDAQDEPAMIMSSLSPQKLFRRAFLHDAGIRFVEGPFRLEDHLFVVTAYLRARRVSTYADYPAYYLTYQTGRSHISQQQPDWAGYFHSVRACVDRVDEEGKDSESRRIMRSRWLRIEALSRLRGDSYERLASPSLLHEVRRLILDRYDRSEIIALKPIDRLVAALSADGRDDDIAALARWESSIEVRTEATSATIGADGTIRVELLSALSSTQAPPAAAHDDDRYPSGQDLLDQLASFARVGVELRHRRAKTRRSLRVTQRGGGVTVAKTTTGDEPLLPGRWTVLALAGEHRSRRRRPVFVPASLDLSPSPTVVGDRSLTFVDDGGLRLRVSTPGRLLTRITRHLRRAVTPRRP